MATHSSILAWEIPWTEDPGELQSMELQESRTCLSDQTTKSRVSTSQQGGIHEKDHVRSKTKCENWYKYFVGKVDNVDHQKVFKMCIIFTSRKMGKRYDKAFHSMEKCRWFINT